MISRRPLDRETDELLGRLVVALAHRITRGAARGANFGSRCRNSRAWPTVEVLGPGPRADRVREWRARCDDLSVTDAIAYSSFLLQLHISARRIATDLKTYFCYPRRP